MIQMKSMMRPWKSWMSHQYKGGIVGRIMAMINQGERSKNLKQQRRSLKKERQGRNLREKMEKEKKKNIEEA